MRVIESIPNVSEGRRPDVIARLAAALRATPGLRLLDYSSDPAHNRSVFTVAGDAPALRDGTLRLFDAAVAAIDLRTHRGEHPRVGAVDVVPFVPIEGTTMAECVELAREVASAVAARFGIPIYLYEEAAARPERRNLEDIRRGQFEGLAEKMMRPGWEPDFGPPGPHVSAGASVIGARMPLIAFNVNLDTDRVEVAKRIAATIRQSGGGLPFVKAIGVMLADRGIAQVSMNLTNHERTPLHRVFDAVVQEAARYGVQVRESEIIGLVPSAALLHAAGHYLRVAGFDSRQVLEQRLLETAAAPDAAPAD